MSNLSTQPYRGTRDFYPEDFALQRYIFETWRQVCNSFGYEEYMTPTIEPLELYASKTSEEIVNDQTFSFTDRGDREITIRPEMTPSVARLVASRAQEFGYPLRLFSIPNCMRYERPQKGRLREFWQLNADIFGVDDISADIEMIVLADAIMKAFGAESSQYEIRINSRKELARKINNAGLKTTVVEVSAVIDRMEKVSKDELLEMLTSHVDQPEDLINSLDEGLNNSTEEIVVSLQEDFGITVVEDAGLARGFDYYTDIVFEVFDKNPENNRSMFGGGRYDNLIGQFGAQATASVGFGMGDATLIEFLKTHNLIPVSAIQAQTQVLLASIGVVETSKLNNIANSLRGAGVNVATDNLDRKPDKKIRTAEKLGIPFVIFIGENEIESQEYTLKNIQSGESSNGQLSELAVIISEVFQGPIAD